MTAQTGWWAAGLVVVALVQVDQDVARVRAGLVDRHGAGCDNLAGIEDIASIEQMNHARPAACVARAAEVAGPVMDRPHEYQALLGQGD